jgi:hypothetical protein
LGPKILSGCGRFIVASVALSCSDMLSLRNLLRASTIASGSGPERSPVSFEPAESAESGAAPAPGDGDGEVGDLDRLSRRPVGAGKSILENCVAIVPGVRGRDEPAGRALELAESGVRDILIVRKMGRRRFRMSSEEGSKR